MLNEKQKAAAFEYVMRNKSKVDAYKAAYNAPSGLTPKQAADRADRVFAGKAIQAEIERLKAENARAEIITRDELLKGVKQLIDRAESSMYREVYNEDGSMEEIVIPKLADVYLKAVDRAAKMIGADAPEEVKNDINVRIDKDLAKYGN